jgi:prepilin peptidase CpaA
MWTMTLWQQGSPFLQWGAAIGASLAGAVADVAGRRIPNRLTGPVLVAGLAWSAYVGGLAGLCEAALACLVLAFPYVLLFLFAGGGAGDAKLMAAIGAWLGLANGMVALVAVSLCAVFLAIGQAAAKKRLRSVLDHVVAFVNGLIFIVISRGKLKDRKGFLPTTDSRQTMPYGIAIFGGVCIAATGVLLWRA